MLSEHTLQAFRACESHLAISLQAGATVCMIRSQHDDPHEVRQMVKILQRQLRREVREYPLFAYAIDRLDQLVSMDIPGFVP